MKELSLIIPISWGVTMGGPVYQVVRSYCLEEGLFNLNGIGRTIDMEYTPIGKAFLNAGYDSHIVGKWHNDNYSLGNMFQFRRPYHE